MTSLKNRQYIICFDGTNNDASDKDKQTNVCKFYNLLVNKEIRQSIYLQGVGARVGEIVSGTILGKTIGKRLLEAYRWLTDQLNSSRQDETYQLYIVGFSRGAYTARIFCWLLYQCGIPTDPNKCKILYKHFRREENSEILEWQSENSHLKVPEIEMLGVWDTVKTAIFPNINGYDELLAPNVKSAFHAMALDEQRDLFPVLHFNKDSQVKELWFAGNHCDVGGGYTEAESGLSNIALQWILNWAMKKDLTFRARYPKQDFNQACHNELDDAGQAILNALVLRGLVAQPPREVAAGDFVHATVKSKMDSGDYLPSIPHPDLNQLSFVER